MRVALAFIHDPELIVLDEMGSGVDPENRRAIWNFLFKRKEIRAILLCTHFMDEADIVADRKAILTKGQLACIGSSAFLKNAYNTGYTLTIEKKSPLQKNFLDGWFESLKLEVQFIRDNEELLEFHVMAKVCFTADFEDIAILVDFLEKEKPLLQIIHSFSIKENDLEEIFSSKELVSENDLETSSEGKDKLLQHLKSFSTPSFIAKTKLYFNFEMRRTISSMSMIAFKLCISIVLIITLWIVREGAAQSSNCTTVLEFNSDFVNRLVFEGAVLETNNT